MMTAASPTLQALAPVLIVDAVEPCLEFWATNLGFTKENEVPGADGKLVFASVKKDGVEIMYQTRASVVADNPAQAAELSRPQCGAVPHRRIDRGSRCGRASRRRSPVVKPRHKTFYGSTEFYVREPGGTSWDLRRSRRLDRGRQLTRRAAEGNSGQPRLKTYATPHSRALGRSQTADRQDRSPVRRRQ